MNNQEFETVVKLPPKKRYAYFIKKVVDYEEVWGLYNDGWAITQDDEGNMLIPFWPTEEFARFCANGEWSEYVPERIDLEEFIQEWLPGLKNDGYKPSIFWNNEDSVTLEIGTLLDDLEIELEKY